MDSSQCSVFYLSQTSDTIPRDEILKNSGAYAAIVRPDTEETRQLLFSQEDIVLFATCRPEETPRTGDKETIEELRKELEEARHSAAVLRELNARLVREIAELKGEKTTGPVQ